MYYTEEDDLTFDELENEALEKFEESLRPSFLEEDEDDKNDDDPKELFFY